MQEISNASPDSASADSDTVYHGLGELRAMLMNGESRAQSCYMVSCKWMKIAAILTCVDALVAVLRVESWSYLVACGIVIGCTGRLIGASFFWWFADRVKERRFVRFSCVVVILMFVGTLVHGVFFAVLWGYLPMYYACRLPVKSCVLAIAAVLLLMCWRNESKSQGAEIGGLEGDPQASRCQEID